MTADRGMPGARSRELLGFALAGAVAYATDLALFTLLRGPAVGLGPLTAKSLSFLAGCSVAYAGNALGTYRSGDRPRGLRPYALFFAVQVAGALVQLACLVVSHYGLGYTGRRADTVSGAGVGMALATILRFWGTRTLVFRTQGVTSGATQGGAPGVVSGAQGRIGSWTG